MHITKVGTLTFSEKKLELIGWSAKPSYEGEEASHRDFTIAVLQFILDGYKANKDGNFSTDSSSTGFTEKKLH